MRPIELTAILVCALIGCSKTTDLSAAPPTQSTSPRTWLRLEAVIPLPQIQGRFDHFAADVATKRLFLTALGNNSLEVIDMLKGGHVASIPGLHKPQGVAFVPETQHIVVANGDDGTVRFLDGKTFQPAGEVRNLDDADNVRYDPSDGLLYVGYTGGLAIIDSKTREKLAAIPLDGHPESFQLETSGPRLFVNVPRALHIAVIDRKERKLIAKWPVGRVENFPMALDEENARLFIGCRRPSDVMVLDTANGNVISRIPCCEDTDDLFFDPHTHRVLVSGGEGCASLIEQTDPNTYRDAGRFPTRPGGRTCFFIPETGRLFVALPQREDLPAEIRVFATR